MLIQATFDSLPFYFPFIFCVIFTLNFMMLFYRVRYFHSYYEDFFQTAHWIAIYSRLGFTTLRDIGPSLSVPHKGLICWGGLDQCLGWGDALVVPFFFSVMLGVFLHPEGALVLPRNAIPVSPRNRREEMGSPWCLLLLNWVNPTVNSNLYWVLNWKLLFSSSFSYIQLLCYINFCSCTT